MQVTPTTATHTHTIINLHGRDSNATDYALEFFESRGGDGRTLDQTFPSIKHVHPAAPQIPSKRFEVAMSQWFDMWTTKNPHQRSADQQQGLARSVADLKDLVIEEARTVGFENVVLCGISQGAATAICALLELDQTLGAFIGFSTWMPEYGGIKAVQPKNKMPVMLEHCEDDEVIDLRFGKTLKKRLEDAGMSVEWHSYEDGGHWINEPEGIDDVVRFLRAVTSLQ